MASGLTVVSNELSVIDVLNNNRHRECVQWDGLDSIVIWLQTG